METQPQAQTGTTPLAPDTNQSRIDSFVYGLTYDPRVILSRVEDGSTESVPVKNRAATPGAVIITTKTRHTLNTNLSDIAILRPTSGVVYPGALVLADRDLIEGQPTPITLPRGPLTLSIDLPGAKNSSRAVDSADSASVQNALNSMLEAWSATAGANEYVNAARSFLSVERAFNSQQVALKLGFSAKWTSGSASSNIEVSNTSESSVVIGYYRQIYYTVVAVPPSRPSAVFAPNVPLQDVQRFISADHPPAYVRSVDYGRILMIRMETSSRDTTAKLTGAFEMVTGGVELGGSVDAKYAEIVQNSRFTVLAIGGGAQTAANNFSGSAADIANLRKYIKADAVYRRDNPGAPISYAVAFLKDNATAAMGFTTDYTSSDSVQYNNGFVRLRHSGAYVAKFYVSWSEPGPDTTTFVDRAWESGEQTAGWTHQVDLPGDARNVRIRAEAATGLVWSPWGEIMNQVESGPTNKWYRATGTTLDRHWDNDG